MYLYPKTIRKSTELGPLDIAIRKPSVDSSPEEAHIVYIQGGEAHYATSQSPQNSIGRWKTEFAIGAASHVSIEFDQVWRRNSSGKYRPVTLGEPWLFRIRGNTLLAQKGETTKPLELDNGVLTGLSTVRAWQNTVTPTDDHGLVVLYIKGGVPHYVNYSRQEGGFSEWGSPQAIPGYTDIERISGFRTNDYRLIVILERAGIIYTVVSARNWAGIGIPGEQLSIGIDMPKITLTDLSFLETSTIDTVSMEVNPSIDLGTIGTDNSIFTISNPDAVTILITIDEPLFNMNLLGFAVRDSRNRAFKIAEAIYDSVGLKLDFVMEDFNNAYGDLTVSYVASSGVTNIMGVPFKAFSKTFTPVGLEPVDIPLPKVLRITNEEG